MEVTVLRKTEQPERLVCQAARGDYYEGYVGDTAYWDLMKSVDFNDSHIERAISHTQDADSYYHPSVDEVKESGNEYVLAEAATISLIESLFSGDPHYGPFEHPQISFAVKGVSRALMAQITRHRHITFDVQSQRYADFSSTEPIVPASLLSNDERHRQYPHVYGEDGMHFNRDEGHVDLSEEERAMYREAYIDQTNGAIRRYQEMVENDVPKEDARFLLPIGTPVNMTFSGNARTFLHLLDMRRKQNAQWEIRELSERLLEELFDWMPTTFEYYEEHGPNKLSP